jgi:hypothetical protein
MEVEILGVLKNVLGPDRDMILARLEGSKPEYTGVAAGMSGSPVYIDGRLLGALSYRIGDFSKEPIAGITPIAQMLEVGREAASRESEGKTEHAAGLPGDPPTGSASAADVEIHPIETPLVFSGFSPQAVALFQDQFRRIGLSPEATLGGGGYQKDVAGAAREGKADRLLPGSAVSALLVKGDLEIAATCTVTFVDPQQVLACGHPITQFGAVSLPMTEAEVVATLPSPLNAFKIINTGRTVGAFTDDRASAIRGVLGATARLIPVSIRTVRDGEARTLHVEVVDNPDITPAAVMVSIYQSLMQNNSYGAETSYVLHGTIDIDGYPDLHLDSLVAPTNESASALGVAMEVGQRFAELFADTTRLGKVRGVDVNIEALPGRRSIDLETAQITQPAAHAGDTVTVEATLRPFQGEARNLRIPIQLPQTLADGPVRILLSDGATLDRITGNNPALRSPSDMHGLIRQLNSAHADDRLYVTLLVPNPQAVVEGRTLPSIPLSMANVLEPLRSNRGMSLNGESAVPVTSIPVAAVLTGQQIVSLDIE